MDSRSNQASPFRIAVIGSPSNIGGAGTELWHTLKLWRSHAADIALVVRALPDARWLDRLTGIGCAVHCVPSDRWRVADAIEDRTVVALCNPLFLRHANVLRQRGLPLVWVNCMEHVGMLERQACRRMGLFDRYVFQSRHQQAMISRTLVRYGYDARRGTIIRGVFDTMEFPFEFRPRQAKEPFVIGRVSRPDPRKFAADTWDVLGRIHERLSRNGVELRARILGWSDEVEKKLGAPPEWAECLAPLSEDVRRFLGTLHATVQINGGVGENWPQAGLEAMASGAPLIVPNRWGWREMIVDHETGFLAETNDDIVRAAVSLAEDEALRHRIAKQARWAVENHADENRLWEQWQEIFRECESTTPLHGESSLPGRRRARQGRPG